MAAPSDYEHCMLAWRITTQRMNLTNAEVIVLAAQFCGLAIAETDMSLGGDEKALDLAYRAMSTACVGKRARARGFGRPVATSAEG
jgi:hypothetical protein